MTQDYAPTIKSAPLQSSPRLEGTVPSEKKAKRRPGRKASTLVRLYFLLKEYPMLKTGELVERLGVSKNAIHSAKKRIKKLVIMSKMDLYCPSCQVLSLVWCDEGLACSQCGQVFEKETVRVNPYGRSPTNSLHFGNALGSGVDYRQLKGAKVIASLAPIIQNQIKIEDSFTRSCLEEAMKVVRTLNLDLPTTDSLGRTLRERIKDFKMAFPLIPCEKKVRQQIISSVLAEGSLAYPRLKPVLREYLQAIKESGPFSLQRLNKEVRIEVLSLLEPFGFDKKSKLKIGRLVKEIAKEQIKTKADNEKLKHRTILAVLGSLCNDFPRIKGTIEEYKTKYGGASQ